MSDLLRVLMISEYPFSDVEQGRGGILQSTFHLIEGFEALNDAMLDLHLISQTPACDRYEDRKIGNITLHFVPRGEREVDKFLLNPLRLLVSFLALKWRLQPHLVHGQGSPLAIALSQIFARKNVQTVHGIYHNEQAVLPREGMGWGRRVRVQINEFFERHYLRNIRNLIALTAEIRSVVAAATNGKARIFPSYVAIDPALFKTPDRIQGAAKQAVTESDFSILFVAAITPRKGLQYLLKAFELLSREFPRLRLRVVGIWDWAPEYVAAEQRHYRDLIESGRLVFTGGVTRDQLFQEYARANLFVLASLSESAPAVVSQAMCMELPLVATRVGGVPEMVEDGVTGLLVEPANAKAIETALRSLLTNPELRSRLATTAHTVAVQRYHPRSVARVTRDVYRAVAET